MLRYIKGVSSERGLTEKEILQLWKKDMDDRKQKKVDREERIPCNLLLQFFSVICINFLFLFHPLLCPLQTLDGFLYIYLFQCAPPTSHTYILKS